MVASRKGRAVRPSSAPPAPTGNRLRAEHEIPKDDDDNGQKRRAQEQEEEEGKKIRINTKGKEKTQRTEKEDGVSACKREI